MSSARINIEKNVIRGVLLDLDGVIHTGNRILPGAKEAVEFLKKNRIPFLFVTNTTTKSRNGIATFLKTIDLEVEEERILNAPRAAREFLIRIGNPKTFLVINEETKKDLAGIVSYKEKPDVILIGDIGQEWNYQIMNDLFQMVKNGARLIALHKGKFWQTESELQLDIGAFVTGIEFATGTVAELIGKPSPAFFQAALKTLSLNASDCVMIGDDIDSDVGGAQACGITGILVKTGKYKKENVDMSSIQPDEIWENLGSLIPFLQKNSIRKS
ncbi:TIGR01458 family HAD-type hydrolase [Leptospira sp. WS92.C1]